MDVNYDKTGLVPAIIQDAETKNVLMLGYMNSEALNVTLETKKVTFYSRSKKRLWTKGEKSGNFLNLISISNDCDKDTLLVSVKPEGPTCHKGTDSCWGKKNTENYGFLSLLENKINERKNSDKANSYTKSLFQEGINKIAQKVGEEAVEVVIEAKDNNSKLFLNESADLLYHFLVLLQAKDQELANVVAVLKSRQ
jgi:phosphoribosyl-ATP pyrophosphohydrolase/phosphoribosyl-AMP cyclohydrolase